MAEQNRIVKSPLKVIVLALSGIVVLLGAAGGVQLFLAYEMSLWEGAAERLPASVQYFGYAGGAYVEVGQAKRGREADVVKKYRAGEEPAAFPVPPHTYPEVTYRLWLLEPGVEYSCRVEKFGSAIEPPEEGGDVIYETYYHFTFR